MHAAVGGRPPAGPVLSLLRDPEHTGDLGQAFAFPVSLPSGPDSTAEGQTGGTPAKTQRGPGRVVLQGRVGDHLRR